MTWEALEPAWSAADVDVPRAWAESGAQWLTADGVDVPVELVRSIAGAVTYLDERGAGLAAMVGAHGVGLLAERAALAELVPSGMVSCGGACRLLRCADGWIAVSLARPDDIASIPAWLGIDGSDGSGGIDELWTAVTDLVSGLEREVVVERAVALGLACSAVGQVDDRCPVRTRSLGAAPSHPVEAALVVNLASLWAGPLAADVLGRLGARVINVESTTRPDGARHTPRFFEALHGGCQSVALPLHTAEGRDRLCDLLDLADVVIEGSRPRALEQMGIHAADPARSGPKVWLSITAHGRRDPHGHHIGFGDDTAAAGGLVGWIGDSPRFLADAVADPSTGVTAAAAVVQLLESPGRWLADVALSRVAASAAHGERARVCTSMPAHRPRVRTDPGRALPFGRDTDAVLAEFGIR